MHYIYTYELTYTSKIHSCTCEGQSGADGFNVWLKKIQLTCN